MNADDTTPKMLKKHNIALLLISSSLIPNNKPSFSCFFMVRKISFVIANDCKMSKKGPNLTTFRSISLRFFLSLNMQYCTQITRSLKKCKIKFRQSGLVMSSYHLAVQFFFQILTDSKQFIHDMIQKISCQNYKINVKNHISQTCYICSIMFSVHGRCRML